MLYISINMRANPAVCRQPSWYNETSAAHLSQWKFTAVRSLSHSAKACSQLVALLRQCGHRANTFCEALRNWGSAYISLNWTWQKSNEPSGGGVNSTDGEQPIKVMHCRKPSPTKKRLSFFLPNGCSRKSTPCNRAIKAFQDTVANSVEWGCKTNLCICWEVTDC